MPRKILSSLNKKSYFILLIIILFFLLLSYLVQSYLPIFSSYIGSDLWGMVAYFLISFLVTVFAPVSNLPLVPIASKLWGWPIAGLLDLAGWFLASIFSFFIARRYGSRIIKKFVPLNHLFRLESMISEKDRFWTALLLRLTIPLDIVSYAFGLFSNISFRVYALSTFFGILPYALIIAYAGSLDFKTQVTILLIGGIVIAVVWVFNFLRIKRKYFKK